MDVRGNIGDSVGRRVILEQITSTVVKVSRLFNIFIIIVIVTLSYYTGLGSVAV